MVNYVQKKLLHVDIVAQTVNFERVHSLKESKKNKNTRNKKIENRPKVRL